MSDNGEKFYILDPMAHDAPPGLLPLVRTLGLNPDEPVLMTNVGDEFGPVGTAVTDSLSKLWFHSALKIGEKADLAMKWDGQRLTGVAVKSEERIAAVLADDDGTFQVVLYEGTTYCVCAPTDSLPSVYVQSPEQIVAALILANPDLETQKGLADFLSICPYGEFAFPDYLFDGAPSFLGGIPVDV
jgi:hypothetical protein